MAIVTERTWPETRHGADSVRLWAMDAAMRALLRELSEACRDVGCANSLGDRGDAPGAEAMRVEARGRVARALEAATADDRERIDLLFGTDPVRFEELRWYKSEELAASLLQRDADLPLAMLRQRLPAFESALAELRRDDPATGEVRLLLRYRGAASPSMLSPLLDLVGRNGDPPGWFNEGERFFHLNLSGEGLETEFRPRVPARYDALIAGVSIHVTLDPKQARDGIPVTLRSRDGSALRDVAEDLGRRLASRSWVAV